MLFEYWSTDMSFLLTDAHAGIYRAQWHVYILIYIHNSLVKCTQ